MAETELKVIVKAKEHCTNALDDKITYGVFWRTALNPDEWRCFSAWFNSYEAAREEANLVLKNPRCISAVVVERVETFEFVFSADGLSSEDKQYVL